MKKSLFAFLALLLLAPRLARADEDLAMLVLSHGGSPLWNKTVLKAVKDAHLSCPYRIFFGMGDTPSEVRVLQGAVRSLEGKGAHTIVVVPLLISSYSEVARQWKYLLGIGVQAGFISNPSFPIEKHATIRYMEPLNDSAVVVEILLDRAQEISERPTRESVLIVAHGPNDEADNQRWNQILLSISERLRKRGGFKSVEGLTLRDDAASEVRAHAVQDLRSRVEAINQKGDRALVVPLLLAPGGIEHKVELELRGMAYAFNTKTLLPDSRLSEWIRSQIP